MHATLADLIDRADGAEVVQRGAPNERLRYLGESASAADLTTDWPTAEADDCALVIATGELYAHDGADWNVQSLTKVARALQDASELADSYIGKRYVLPLPLVPRPVVVATADIARYYLHDDGVTEVVKERHKQALAHLDQIRSGSIDIPGATETGDKQSQGAATVKTTGAGRVFSRDSMRGF